MPWGSQNYLSLLLDSVVKGPYTTCSHFFKLLVIYKTSEEIAESLFPSKGTILSAEVLLIKLKK